MDVELFVHGVPSGEGFWGKEEDRNYFGSFYDHSSDEVKFLIQARALKGKPYCYYNYLVYKTVGAQAPNIVANDGRDGSYFGITLRLDAYCKDIFNMYRILDTIYNVYVVGSLLKIEKSKLKYTIPDFANVSNVLEGIEKTTIQLIQNAFSAESFTRLDGFALSGNNCPVYNLYDCTEDLVISALKQYGRVAVSPYYPSNKETSLQQQFSRQLQAAQKQYEDKLRENADAYKKEKAQINESLSSLQNEMAQKRQEISQRDDKIKNLNAELSRLQTEVLNAGPKKKISQIVASIKGPVTELSAVLKRVAPESPVSGPNSTDTDQQLEKKKFSMVKLFNSFLSILNFLLLLIVILILLNPSKEKPNPVEGNFEVEALEMEVSDLQKQLDEAQMTIKSAEPVIDIKEYSQGDLKLQMTYHVEALVKEGNGTWKVDGCKIAETKDPNKVIITPTDSVVTIMYNIGNQTKVRKLNAK